MRNRPEYPINKPKEDINISFLLCALGRPAILNVLPCPPSCGMWHDVSDAESSLMWFIQTQAKGPKVEVLTQTKMQRVTNESEKQEDRHEEKQQQMERRVETVDAYGGLWHTAEITVGINLLQAFCCS